MVMAPSRVKWWLLILVVAPHFSRQIRPSGGGSGGPARRRWRRQTQATAAAMVQAHPSGRAEGGLGLVAHKDGCGDISQRWTKISGIASSAVDDKLSKCTDGWFLSHRVLLFSPPVFFNLFIP